MKMKICRKMCCTKTNIHYSHHITDDQNITSVDEDNTSPVGFHVWRNRNIITVHARNITR